jgi:hypothetical protein
MKMAQLYSLAGKVSRFVRPPGICGGQDGIIFFLSPSSSLFTSITFIPAILHIYPSIIQGMDNGYFRDSSPTKTHRLTTISNQNISSVGRERE